MARKADIVEHLAAHLEGVTKKLANEAVDAVFEHISSTLAKGERVQIPGFGTFEVRATKERQGLNPQTKQRITIPAGKKVAFKAGKALKDAVK